MAKHLPKSLLLSLDWPMSPDLTPKVWATLCRENRRAAQGEEGDDSENGPDDEHDSQEADDSGALRPSIHTAMFRNPSGTLICLRLVKCELATHISPVSKQGLLFDSRNI